MVCARGSPKCLDFTKTHRNSTNHGNSDNESSDSSDSESASRRRHSRHRSTAAFKLEKNKGSKNWHSFKFHLKGVLILKEF